MRAWAKLVLGAAAFAPMLSAVGFGAYLAFRLIAFDIESGGALPVDPIEAIQRGPFDADDLVLVGVVAVTIALLQLALVGVFAVLGARDPRLSGPKLLLWTLAFLLAGMLALPLYFLLYVLRDPVRTVELPDIP